MKDGGFMSKADADDSDSSSSDDEPDMKVKQEGPTKLSLG